MAIIGALRVVLGMDSAAFNDGVGKAQKRMAGFQKQMQRTARNMQRTGRNMSVGLTAPLIAAAYKSANAMKVQEQAVASVEAALKSMGDGAGYTLTQLEDMAAKLQEKSLYGDEAILGRVTANLLTFGNVSGEVFQRAQQMALDLSARLGQDLQSSTVMLGKALNDPVKGLTALSRVGVSFTEQQKQQIKAMAEVGDVAGAQRLMLAELEKQYAGQAQALANTDSGKIQQAMNALGDASEKIGAIILPVMADIAQHVRRAAAAFQDLEPRTQKFIVAGAAIAAAIGPALIVLGSVVSSVGTLATVAVAASLGMAKLAVAMVAKVAPAAALVAKSMLTVRGALISTGVGALVVGAGYLVAKFIELADKAGGFSNALTVIKAVASEVWGRIAEGAAGVALKISASWAGVRSAVLDRLAGIVDGVAEFGNTVIGVFVGAKDASVAAWGALPGAIAQVVASAANGVISGVEAMINKSRQLLNKFIAGVNSLMSGISGITGIDLTINPLAPVQIDRVKVQVADLAGDVQAAFNGALGVDYTGNLSKGLRATADDLAGVEAAADKAGTALLDAAGRPLQTLADLSEAQQKLRKNTEDGAQTVHEAMDAATGSAEALADKLDNVGDAAAGAGRKGKTAMKEMADEAKKLREQLSNIGQNFIKDLSLNGVSGAFSNLGDSLRTQAATSFSGIVQQSFSSGGGGFSGLVTSLGTSFKGVTSALSTIGSGSFFSGIGSLVSSALPIVGAVSAVVNIIKGFSSSKQIGSALNMGVRGGEVQGGEISVIQKKTWWGLKKKVYDAVTEFDDATKAGLQGVIDTLQGDVRGIYESAGVKVTDAMLDGVRLAVTRIDTTGKSEQEIQAEIDGLFTRYGNALSRAVGKVSLQLAANFADVQTLLTPLGNEFSEFSKANTQAANRLSKVAGGINLLATSTAAFYDGFFTDAQKVDHLKGLVGGVFDDLGLAVPKTDAAFRRLVLAQDLSTGAGRRVYAALTGVATQFDAVTDAAQEARQQLAAQVAAERAALREARKELAALAAAERAALRESRGSRRGLRYDVSGDAAKLALTQTQVANAFAKLGEDVPETRRAFVRLLDSLNLTDETHRKNLKVLQGVAPAFMSLRDAAKDAARAQKDLAKAEAERIADLRAARSGDVFGLMSPERQLEEQAARVATAFASVGMSVPRTLSAFSNRLQKINLTTHSDVYDKLRSVLPDFKAVKAAGRSMAEAEHAAIAAERERKQGLREDREELLFGLLGPRQKLTKQTARVERVFASLGEVVPRTLGAFATRLRQINMFRDSDVFEKLRDILPDFEAMRAAAQDAAEAAKAAAEAQKEAAAALAEKLGTAFDLSGDRYRTEYAARLGAIATARGYSLTQDLGVNGAATVSGQVGKLRETTKEHGELLSRMVRVIEGWDMIGMPPEKVGAV